MRFPAKFWTVLLAGFATCSASLACSLAYSPISVGSSFKVKVSGAGGPVKGLRLKLTGPDHRVRSVVTDGNGIARFLNAPWGTQYLSADPDNDFGDELQVQPSGPADIVIPMRWPAREPIHVRSLAGIMRAPGAVPGETDQSAVSLELLDGISGRTLSTVNTTGRGEFDFGSRGQGIYFIHLKPYSTFNQQIQGLISIAVDPATPADRLDLDLTWTSCGLKYVNQLQCPQSDLRVKKPEGNVHDSNGLPVRTGLIVLLDAGDRQVARVGPDRDGNFSVPDPLAGTFELWVGRGGFSPLHTAIRIEPTAAGSSLEIEAAYGDACSKIRVR